MIRMLTAYTREIDDIETSAADILRQLDTEKRLLRHSVGLLAFHPDFLETGAVKAISAALPFDTIGGTCSGTAVAGAIGDLMLTIAVLTSDDAVFRAGGVLLDEDDPKPAIHDLYAGLAPLSAEKPSLLLTVAPVMSNIGGDDLVEALDADSGGVPLFGGLAASPRPDFSGVETCLNGEHQANLLTLIAVYGAVNPEFYRTAIPGDRVIRQDAVITKSEKNLLQTINDRTPLDYLESIGLANGGSIAGLTSIPFVLTMNDGSLVVRAAYEVTEEGYLRAYGAVPQGVPIGFADSSAEFVLQSTRENIGQALASSGGGSALIVACDARRWTLGARPTAEMREAALCLDNMLPYRIAYASGELCPVRNSEGRLVNTFQNLSTIACRL